EMVKFEHRCTFYLFLAVSYCLLFSIFGREKKCVHSTNANQTLHHLINTQPIENLLLHSPSVNGRSYRLLFLVVTSVNERKEREEIRRTWAARKQSRLRSMEDALVVFVIGRSPLVEEEALEYRDILQVDIDDTYRNMVYKIEIAFRWVSLTIDSQFVVKVDSDTVVHIDRLDEQLERLDQRGSDHWMACFRIQNSQPIRDSCNEWYISSEDYPPNVLPDYCAGPFYAMKRNSFERIVRRMGSIRVIEVEDAFFTGIVAGGIVDLFCAAEMIVPRYTDYSECSSNSPSLSVLNTHFQFNGYKSRKNLTTAFERLKYPYCHTFYTPFFHPYFTC
ncbi:hypothetical protein PMAYCL1PPCAC_12194, partial [Pristionchus mayeri]